MPNDESKEWKQQWAAIEKFIADLKAFRQTGVVVVVAVNQSPDGMVDASTATRSFFADANGLLVGCMAGIGALADLTRESGTAQLVARRHSKGHHPPGDD